MKFITATNGVTYSIDTIASMTPVAKKVEVNNRFNIDFYHVETKRGTAFQIHRLDFEAITSDAITPSWPGTYLINGYRCESTGYWVLDQTPVLGWMKDSEGLIRSYHLNQNDDLFIDGQNYYLFPNGLIYDDEGVELYEGIDHMTNVLNAKEK